MSNLRDDADVSAALGKRTFISSLRSNRAVQYAVASILLVGSAIGLRQMAKMPNQAQAASAAPTPDDSTPPPLDPVTNSQVFPPEPGDAETTHWRQASQPRSSGRQTQETEAQRDKRLQDEQYGNFFIPDNSVNDESGRGGSGRGGR